MVSKGKESSFPCIDIAQVQAKRAWPTDSDFQLRSVLFRSNIRRIRLWCIGVMISNAFGSLIASGILDAMDGVMGQAAWR